MDSGANLLPQSGTLVSQHLGKQEGEACACPDCRGLVCLPELRFFQGSTVTGQLGRKSFTRIPLVLSTLAVAASDRVCHPIGMCGS